MKNCCFEENHDYDTLPLRNDNCEPIANFEKHMFKDLKILG